jgi:hypothetical protein
MLSFFCLKEVTSINDFNLKNICVIENVNEDAQTNDDSDASKEEMSLTDLSVLSFNFKNISCTRTKSTITYSNKLINPFYEIQDQPPQNK